MEKVEEWQLDELSGDDGEEGVGDLSPLSDPEVDPWRDEDFQGGRRRRRKNKGAAGKAAVLFLYGLLSGLSGGVFYAVGVFAADLKEIEGYTQTGVNLVAGIVRHLQ